MAELVDWPKVERYDNPLDPESAVLAPVEIRFRIKPGFGELLDPELAAECSIAGRPAPTPGAVVKLQEWSKDAIPTLYCYTLARELHEGDEVKLRVHPRDQHHREQPDVVWEKDFRVRTEGDKFRLE